MGGGGHRTIIARAICSKMGHRTDVPACVTLSTKGRVSQQFREVLPSLQKVYRAIWGHYEDSLDFCLGKLAKRLHFGGPNLPVILEARSALPLCVSNYKDP